MAERGPTILAKEPGTFALAVAEIAFARGVNEGIQISSDIIAAHLSRAKK